MNRNALEPWLLEILVCPRCHTRLELTADGGALRCPQERLRYPIEDGVAQLLPESGQPEDRSGGNGEPARR